MAIKNRYEFMYYVSCVNANPNGDPDMDNTPRMDPETMKGYISDVATKRRIRNYVDMAYHDKEGMNQPTYCAGKAGSRVRGLCERERGSVRRAQESM